MVPQILHVLEVDKCTNKEKPPELESPLQQVTVDDHHRGSGMDFGNMCIYACGEEQNENCDGVVVVQASLEAKADESSQKFLQLRKQQGLQESNGGPTVVAMGEGNSNADEDEEGWEPDYKCEEK